MSQETRRSNNERNKYGICLNDECPKCKGKEVQQIPMRKEFVCAECGSELRECPPPKKRNKKLIPIIAAVVVIIGGVIAAIVIPKGSNTVETDSDNINNELNIGENDTIIADSIPTDATLTPVDAKRVEDSLKHVAETVKKTVTKSNSTTGGLTLSYGKYTGAIKNGYPHGQGRLTYTTNRVINKNDPKGRTAAPGDYVIGEFFNGFLVYGKHYNASGELVESLNVGVGSEDSYDSK